MYDAWNTIGDLVRERPRFASWSAYQVRDLAAAERLDAACLSHV